MTREELEHIIRACADITDQCEFVVVGSQSILGSFPNPESVFTMSAEADIYPFNAPELGEEIDGAIGEGSAFHETYGYYAQGVGPDTAVLPDDWMDRVHRLQNANTNHRVGYCLDDMSNSTRRSNWSRACRWRPMSNVPCAPGSGVGLGHPQTGRVPMKSPESLARAGPAGIFRFRTTRAGQRQSSGTAG